MNLIKENAKHVVTFDEAIPTKASSQGLNKALKIIVCVIIGVLCLGTLVFGENLFLEINPFALIMLGGLAISVFFGGKKQMKAAPMEIWFFDDHLVILKVKHYYSKNLSRKEFNKIYYKDISGIKWNEITQQVTFRGAFEIEWYKYNEDGSLESAPSDKRTVEGMSCFYFNLCQEIDFLALFKEYIPCDIDATYKKSSRSVG